MAALLRMYAGAASQFALRTEATPSAAVIDYDQTLHGIWAELLQRPMTAEQWRQATLPQKLGGLGIQTATSRVTPAYWSSLTATLPAVARALPGDVYRMLLDSDMGDNAAKAQTHLLNTSGGASAKAGPLRMDLYSALQEPIKQSALMVKQHTTSLNTALSQASVQEAAFLRSCGGAGVGAFLNGPPAKEMLMADDIWETAVRFRLNMPHAGMPAIPASSMQCQHRHLSKATMCNQPLGNDNNHAIHCSKGGWTQRRHDAVARVLAGIQSDVFEVASHFNQATPQWDHQKANGEWERAYMDLVYTDHQGQPQYVDVALVSAVAGSTDVVLKASRKDGAAAARATERKHDRYGPEVWAFVLELGGRPGREAREWVARVLEQSSSNPTYPTTYGTDIWSRISCVAQKHIALQLKRAVGC